MKTFVIDNLGHLLGMLHIECKYVRCWHFGRHSSDDI